MAVVVAQSGGLRLVLAASAIDRRRFAGFMALSFASPFVLIVAYFVDRQILLSLDSLVLVAVLGPLFMFLLEFIAKVTFQDQQV